MFHLLIAPNAYKNTLTATEAATAMLEGFLASGVRFTYELFPVGDGGDGTGDLLVDRLKGFTIPVSALDPLGRTIDSKYGIIDDGLTAIIEMTYASGIKHLRREELDPLNATSFGTGQLMKHALDRGVKKLIISMGGSATVDGGTGILRALGFRFFDRVGKELQYIKEMNELHAIDSSYIHPSLKQASINVLCDVKNVICGPEGAAAVYGPQKGADSNTVRVLDNALFRLTSQMQAVSGKTLFILPGGGTAGGAAAGLFAMIDAKLVHGIDYYLDVTGFNNSLASANFVITGEGSLDDQTMQGKAPYGVASRAKVAGKTTICIPGIMHDEPNDSMRKLFDHILPTTSGSEKITNEIAYLNLKQTAQQAAKELF